MGRRSAAAHTVAQHGYLRDARARFLQAASVDSRKTARNLRSADDGAGDRTFEEARRHCGGVDAGASPLARSSSRSTRTDELLGLQQLRLLRARAPARGLTDARRRGA